MNTITIKSGEDFTEFEIDEIISRPQDECNDEESLEKKEETENLIDNVLSIVEQWNEQGMDLEIFRNDKKLLEIKAEENLDDTFFHQTLLEEFK